MDNKIQINTPGEIVLLQGTAPDKVTPSAYVVSGEITTPLTWLDEKASDIDIIKAHVEVSYEDRQILLILNLDQENERYKSFVKGEMALNPRFKEFCINTGKRWELNDLANFLKFNRRFFMHSDESLKVISGLKSFRASVARDIEKTQDDRGNHRRLDDKRIHSDLPETFTLTMQIFKLDVYASFDVELCIEEKEGVVRAFLQSVSLEEIIENRVKTAINEVINGMPDDIAIIYK